MGHIYYGDRLEGEVENYLLRIDEHPFTPSVVKERNHPSWTRFPTEYPTGGVGDFRESCLNVRNADGRRGCEIFYEGHEIYKGKKKLEGLPPPLEPRKKWRRWI